MERSSSGQEPTHLPRWEEVAWRKPSERQVDAVLCTGADAQRSGKGTWFNCLKFRLGSAGEPTVCSHCYPVPYMKIPANNQVILPCVCLYIYILFVAGETKWKSCLRHLQLMPDPHSDRASEDYFTISQKQVILWHCLYLDLVSMCWNNLANFEGHWVFGIVGSCQCTESTKSAALFVENGNYQHSLFLNKISFGKPLIDFSYSDNEENEPFIIRIILQTQFFLPEASYGIQVLLLPASVCVSVRPSVCPSINKFVCTITRHLFKLRSPNLDQRCKTTWLRSLVFWGFFWGVIDLDFQAQI